MIGWTPLFKGGNMEERMSFWIVSVSTVKLEVPNLLKCCMSVGVWWACADYPGLFILDSVKQFGAASFLHPHRPCIKPGHSYLHFTAKKIESDQVTQVSKWRTRICIEWSGSQMDTLNRCATQSSLLRSSNSPQILVNHWEMLLGVLVLFCCYNRIFWQCKGESVSLAHISRPQSIKAG